MRATFVVSLLSTVDSAMGFVETSSVLLDHIPYFLYQCG